MKPIVIVAAIASAVAAWGLPRSADAQINICNSGDRSLSVAVVSEPGLGRFIWDARGWYLVKPGRCSQVVRALKYKYFLAFITRRADDSTISIVWRPAKRDDAIKVLKRHFCVHPTNKFSRRGSLPFLAQCPSGYQRALFPVLISKPVCYDNRGRPVSSKNCIASRKLYVKATNSARGQALTRGQPVDQRAEAERQAQSRREGKAVADIYAKALEYYVKGTRFDPDYEIDRRPGGNIKMKPAAAPNKRAYLSCRKQFRWKDEAREGRLCRCVAKNVRFDKFTKKQMLRIDNDFYRYDSYGTLREQVANRNAFDKCVNRHANIKRR